MKNNNYHLHGGVEKHSDGSFTIYGSYYDYSIGSDVLYHKRFYDFDISEARKITKEQLRKLANRGATL
jgi:hypothetical protein